MSLSDPGEDISGSLMNVVPMVSSFVPLSLKEGKEKRDIIEIKKERGRREEGGRRDGGRVSKRECVCMCVRKRRVRGWSCA